MAEFDHCGISELSLVIKDDVFCETNYAKYLLSISQLCNKVNNITFDSPRCMVIKTKYDQTIFTISRSENTYTVNLNKISSNDVGLLSKKEWILAMA